ncbi:hypothetical protein ACWGLE_18535 [Streptomyces sp. NPDC055897]
MGRPRLYCGPRCRRQAQRDRDQASSASRALGEWWDPIADDLLHHAFGLQAGRRLPLGHIVSLVDAASRDLECLMAVAISNARDRRESWVEIGGAEGRTAASARARWGGSQIERLLDSYRGTVPRRAVPGTQRMSEWRVLSVSPAAQLAMALCTLHEASGRPLPQVAWSTGVPLPTLTALLAGAAQRAPAAWPEVYAAVHALGGSPGDLRHLWECATTGPSPSMPVGAGTGRLAAALRGALLAAGVAAPLSAAPSMNVPSALTAILRGGALPSWPQLTAALEAVGADAGTFRYLWAEARAAEGLTSRPGVEA